MVLVVAILVFLGIDVLSDQTHLIVGSTAVLLSKAVKLLLLILVWEQRSTHLRLLFGLRFAFIFSMKILARTLHFRFFILDLLALILPLEPD